MTKNVIVSNNKLVTEDGAAVPSDGFVNVGALATQLAGTALRSYQGVYDASSNLFPTTGGSGAAGAIAKGDTFLISVAGTLGTTSVIAGDEIIAEQDVPGQTAANWGILSHALGYVPARAAGAWVAASLINSWVALGSGFQTPRYRLNGDVVELEGGIKSGTTGTAALTLPGGFVPAATHRFTVDASGGAAFVAIGTDGNVQINDSLISSVGTFALLDGIRFSTL